MKKVLLLALVLSFVVFGQVAQASTAPVGSDRGSGGRQKCNTDWFSFDKPAHQEEV